MALMIGGLKQQQALKQLGGISRQTLHRYRQRKDYPGDDADFAVIAAYVNAVKSSAGRKAKSQPHQPATLLPDNPEDDATDLEHFQNAGNLDEEMKLTLIEKNKTHIRDYQKRCMEEYRQRLTKQINEGLDLFFDEITHMDLTHTQIDNLRQALRRAQQKVAGNNPAAMQPSLEL